MKIAKTLGAVILGLLILAGFGKFFVSQLGAPRSSGPAGVIAAPPPEYHVVDRGAMTPAEAADALRMLILARPRPSKVGIKFASGGAVLYWLADTGADVLEERAAGASGTRTQTVWPGHVLDRLLWAHAHGDPSAPGLPPPERKNLYH